MKKIGKFFVGLSMAAIMSLGLVACDNGGGSSSSGSNSNKPSNSTKPSSTASVDNTPEDTGTLKDNVFEAEAALYDGVSSNNGNNFGHACMSKSYVFDTSFSGNLSIRNVAPQNAENNTITFKFKSDKAVKVKMEIAVASRYENNTWTAMNFSQMYNTQVNGKYLTADVEVPAATAADIVQNNNYTAMKVVELPITLVEGDNTITFTALSKACNLDYINVKTSANLTGWTNHYWDESGANITVTKEPTLEATGTISFACEEGEASHAAQNWTMPKLNENDYKVNADKTVYSITVAGKEFKFNAAGADETPDVPSVTYDAELNNEFTSDKVNELKLVYGAEGVTTSGELSEDGEAPEGAIGYFDNAGATLSYTFSLSKAGKADFVWSVAGSKWNGSGNDGLADMGANLTVTLDGNPVDVSGIALPAGDGTTTSAWWNLQNVIVKDVDLAAGEHTFAVEVTAAGGLNVGSMNVYSDVAFGSVGSTELTEAQQQFPVMKADSWYKFGSTDKYTEADIMTDGKLTITSANPARMDLFKIDADADVTNDANVWKNLADKTDNFADSGTAFYGYEYTYDMALSATGEFSLILFGTSGLPAEFNGTSHRGIYLFFTDGTITVKQSGTGKDAVQATGTYEGTIADITSVKLAITRLSASEILVNVYVNGERVVLSGTPNTGKISLDGQFVDTVVTATNGYGQRFGVVPAGETVVTIADCKVSKSDAVIERELVFTAVEVNTAMSLELDEANSKVYVVVNGTFTNADAATVKASLAFDAEEGEDNSEVTAFTEDAGNIVWAIDEANGTFTVKLDVTDLDAVGAYWMHYKAGSDLTCTADEAATITLNGKVYCLKNTVFSWGNRDLFRVEAAPAVEA